MYTCTVEPWLSGPWLSRFLDYLDFFLWSQFGCEYLLVTIKIRGYILFRLQHWKVQSNARFFFYFQTAKAVLACIITNEEHSNEFWLAQSCIVAKWNFTLFYIGSPSVVSKTNKLASWTLLFLFTTIMSLKRKRSIFSIKYQKSIIVRLEKGEKRNQFVS